MKGVALLLKLLLELLLLTTLQLLVGGTEQLRDTRTVSRSGTRRGTEDDLNVLFSPLMSDL